MCLVSYRSQSGQHCPLPQPCTGILWNSLGVCSSERSPPAPPWWLNLQHPQPPGSQSVWLQQGRAAEKGQPTWPAEQGCLDWWRCQLSRLSLLLCHQQCVTFLMPGFYGWMSDSDRQASPFSDSQAEASKCTASSKISGKSGEYLYVFVVCTR